MAGTAEAHIAVRVNGEPAVYPVGATVLDVARACGLRDDERGVAIARCGEVVPRGRWADAAVQEGDTLEVVRAAAGG